MATSTNPLRFGGHGVTCAEVLPARAIATMPHGDVLPFGQRHGKCSLLTFCFMAPLYRLQRVQQLAQGGGPLSGL